MKNKINKFLLLVIRKLYYKAFRKTYTTKVYEDYVELSGRAANDYIREMLLSSEPFMISKFGTIELNALVAYKNKIKKSYDLNDYVDFITGKSPGLWWDPKLDALCSNAGFFPNDIALLPKFYDVNYDALLNINVLGSYIENEKHFNSELKEAIKVDLDGYYAPFFYSNPWTQSLEGKKVLVVHPFAEDIRSQYHRRQDIWEDKNVLPEFELITYKSVVSMLGNETEFDNWFSALDKMQGDISKIDFDIALIGCGAYGMPLASFIKNMDKKVVHLAGWTQVLFGIKGKRWDDLPSVSKYYNDAWIRPNANARPSSYSTIEKGCYW